MSDGNEGSRLRMFVDIAKGHRPMTLINSATLAPVDENGWPTTDAQTVLFDVRAVPAWAPPIDDPDQFQPDFSGVYKMSFQGQADLRGFDVAQFEAANQVYDPDTNTTRLDLAVASGTGLVAIQFVNTRRTPQNDLNTGIANLRLIRPGYPEDTDQVFTSEFLAALQPFAVLRFMGFLMSNSTNPFYGDAKNHIEWSDRRLPTDATQQRTRQRAAGVAWEYAIDICNLAGKEMWLNIPVAASDDYIFQLAQLIQNRLNPGLNIYIEVSNEVWNYGFTQYTYNKMAAVDEVTNQAEPYLNNPPVSGSGAAETWAARRQARRLIDAIRIFASVFGQDRINNRLRGVYAWWTIKPGEYRSTLDWVKLNFGAPSSWFWALAKTNYYNDSKAQHGETPEQVLAAMSLDSDNGRTWTTQLRTVADDFGLKLITYEAGPDNGGGSTANIANRIRANRLQQMGDLMKHDFIDNWNALGGELYMYLDVAGAYSRYGSWGQTEDVANLNTAKLRAIADLTGWVLPIQ